MSASRSFRVKLVERMFWAGVLSALGFVTVDTIEVLFDVKVPDAWVPFVASLLSFLKGNLAKKVGDPNDPATLPPGV